MYPPTVQAAKRTVRVVLAAVTITGLLFGLAPSTRANPTTTGAGARVSFDCTRTIGC